MCDELDSNVFYKALVTTFSGRFNEAVKSGWVICVPTKASLEKVRITPAFIGFEVPTVVNVLSVEYGYSKDMKPFKVLLVDKPFEGMASCLNDAETYQLQTTHMSYNETRAFLGIPLYAEPMRELDNRLNLFNKNYVVLPQYLDDMNEQIYDIIKTALKAFKEVHTIPLLPDCEAKLESAVESYAFGKLYHKIFGAIRKKLSDEDAAIYAKTEAFHQAGLTAQKLAVQEAFTCALPRAVVELASLDSKYTPADKLWCLKNTLNMITQEIEEHLIESGLQLKYGKEPPCLTSDELIPVLVCVITKAKLSHLGSNLYYISHFGSEAEKQNCDFALVTFHAAVQFIKSYDIFKLLTAPPVQDDRLHNMLEMSLTELMEASLNVSYHEKSDADGTPLLSGSERRPIDQQLARITRMIEASTSDFQTYGEQELRNLEKSVSQTSQ